MGLCHGRRTTKFVSCACECCHFGDLPMSLECRLSVEDSPNSGEVIIDAVRCAKIALDRGMGR